jgi:hypothetical protein
MSDTPRRWLPILGEAAAWLWTLLAAGGGIMLLIERGPWPLTNGWFALASGLASCPLNRLSGRTRFVAALLIWLAGQIARRVPL